jgi:hypothetical protein
MLIGYVEGSTKVYKCLDLYTLQVSNHSDVKFDEDLFPGPWIKRPANMKLSMLQKKNLPGSAVDTRLGQAVLRPPMPFEGQGVPLSSMNPFWMVPAAHAACHTATELCSQKLRALQLAAAQPEYNERGAVVFGTCAYIHKLDVSTQLLEAEAIVLGVESLSHPSRSGDARLDQNGDPLTYADAMRQDPVNWNRAIQEELSSLRENGTWAVENAAQLPPGCKPIPGKWVFKRKALPDGGIRYKARMVIQGFRQRYGIDFMETYAPTASLTAFRLLIAIAVYNGWSLRAIDVITAFLNGDLDTEVWMKPPEGLDIDPLLYVLKLRKALYGLKQAPRVWWQKVHGWLIRSGFHCCDAEPAIFTRHKDGQYIILLLFVDDIFVVGSSEGAEQFVRECSAAFKIRDLGTPKLFLGIQIERTQSGSVLLHQADYTKRILERFNAPQNPVQTPMDAKTPLVEASENNLLPEQDAAEYRAAVGALLYLMLCTRPDLAYTLSRLSKFSSKPSTKHAEALKRVLRYLRGTINLGIEFNAPDPTMESKLYGYSDSDFAADLNNRRSTSGFIFLLNGGPISWKSKQQSLIATSTHDAEYIGLANASYEITWLRQILAAILPEYTEHKMPANILLSDNQGAIASANKPRFELSARSKHIDIRFHVIRDAIQNGLIRLEYVRTHEMTADILTKALPREPHQQHVAGMGMARAPGA